jgi:hemin uptake protein HemP
MRLNALQMKSHPVKRPSIAHEPATAVEADVPVQSRSEDLLQGRRELLIRHGDEQYRLRLTRMNKLILTK